MAILSGTDAYSANLSGADLRRTKPRCTHLHFATLTGADLRGADLTGADLRRADLTGADLRRADLTGADLRRTKLKGARANSLTQWAGFDWRRAGVIEVK